MNPVEAVLLGGALVTLLVGAILDFRTHRIPNSVTFGSAILGFAANLAVKQIPGAGQSTEGWLAGVGILLIPFMMRGVGGGDVKLLAAAGAWYGPSYVFHALFWAALVGSVAALVLLAVNGQVVGTFRALAWRISFVVVLAIATVFPGVLTTAPNRLRRIGRLDGTQSGLRLSFPFGPALALGGLMAVAVG